MRTSLLSRSVIAVASLAIGSVALAAAPANAASASGVTRDTVLTAVNGVRTAESTNSNLSAATSRALRALVLRTCDVRVDEDEYANLDDVFSVTAAGIADGLLIRSSIDRSFGGDYCTFAAFATTDGAFELSGTAIISARQRDRDQGTYAPVAPVLTAALSGDAFVTAPLNHSYNDYRDFSVSASGTANKMTAVTTSTKVATPKTAKQKKAAKKAQDKSLKAAKKSYVKALDKAGKNKKKIAAAKKAYSKKKASAKAKYKAATAKFKIVKSTSKVLAETRPFSITTVEATPPPV